MHGVRAQPTKPGTDDVIATLAADQYGVVTRAQLVTAGLGRGQISRRLAAGRLHRLHAGTYAVGHRAPRREARWLAAVLACGDGAALSHRSAASLWRIREAEGPLPDVTTPTGSRRRHPNIAVHRAALLEHDLDARAGISVTSPARTLVDLAHELDRGALRRALSEAQFLRLFDLAATRAALIRRPSGDLRVLLEDLALTQSGLEDRLVALCVRYGIDRPLTQQPLFGRRVDFLWPRQRVVVETDGWEGHGTRRAFQADRETSNAFQLRGYYILRFTSADLERRPALVARQIRSDQH